MPVLPAPIRLAPTLAASWFGLALMASVCGAAPTIVDLEVGFDGRFKQGLWSPARLTVEDADGLRPRLIAPDSDGSPTLYEGPAIQGAQRQTVELYVRLGRLGASIDSVLIGDDAESVTRTFLARASGGEGVVRWGLAPTSRLIVSVSPTGISNLKAVANAAADRSTAVVQMASLSGLPQRWAGLEPVDCLVVSISDPAAFEGITASSPQVRALTEWIEMGGRLVIAGASGAEAALGDGGALAGLVPGQLSSLRRLEDASPLDRYAESESPLGGGRRLAMPVARLADVTGEIEAHGEGLPVELPLVVRARRGFGEVTFVGVDLDDGLIAEWSGASRLLARLCRLPTEKSTGADASSKATLVTRGYTDLSGALQQKLGARFAGVTSVSMMAIVGATMIYLLLIGPVDFFLLKGVVGRMQATWLTFPAVVLLFGGGAYLLAERVGGDQRQINRLQLIDVDGESGVVRGTLWAQAFAPAAGRHDVALAVGEVDGAATTGADGYVTWLGVPGAGIGGVQTEATANLSRGGAYRQAASLVELIGLPINVRSTKPLAARWRGRAGGAVESQLTSPYAGVLNGAVVNNTGGDLTECWLAYGDWAWRVGDLPAGRAASIAGLRRPLRLKTLVREDYLKTDAGGRTSDVASYSIDGLLHLMMFTEAVDGAAYAGLPNDFQGYTDLSRLLDERHAIFVGRAADNRAGARLESDGKPWAKPTDADRTYYRFVLPVGEED